MTRTSPQRPRQHVLETESRIFVENILPSEWIVNSTLKDYGIDLDVEIVENTNVTGAHFSMQLKSTDELKVNKDGSISYSCKTSTLRYFLEKTEHVIFLVFDAKNRLGYWIWIKDYLQNDLPKNKKWKKQTTATIKIPKNNLFTDTSLAQIKSRVMKTHRQAKLLSTIQALDNPYIGYALQIEENKEIVTMYPKYPGAEKDYPISFHVKFRFDKSSGGQKAQQTLQNVMKKGQSATIDSKYIESIEFPELLNPEIFGGEPFKPDKLFISPISQNREFPAVIAILDQNEDVLLQIPYVEFKEKRYGSEEVLFSNDDQQIPTKFSITLKTIDHTANISIKNHFDNLNVFQTFETLRIQKAFATGAWLCINHLITNTRLVKSKIPKNFVSEPPSVLLEVAKSLSYIQEKTQKVIPWPKTITYDEKDFIDEIVSIINSTVVF